MKTNEEIVVINKKWSICALSALLFQLQSHSVNAEHLSGINKLVFHDHQYNKAFVGNGFLITHNDKVYAVTVKHALLEAKTPTMASVSIEEHVKNWTIHPNKQPDNAVRLGKLLNQDDTEKLDMQVLQKDWLVFEVESNQSDLKVLSLRNSPLKKGETLTAFGCSYANAERCSQDEYTGEFLKKDGANLRITMNDLQLSELRGLSGSPVLDESGKLVGIVSNVMRSESGDGFDFAPANLDYLKQVLATL
ncbi:serine protease [Alteromonas sediminis]|uniref:Serine protease n=1 Tax=Alteromonas sediminis TaxID=2259342 RepID=A0A3N5Z9E5_9ALTE|nr:serine protease [Alteromonas sediminis]RPJ65838.1 serine protease [Alteromonas sediminis]